jgi:hypothetical protein
MRFKILIGTVAALSLLAACGSSSSGGGGGGAGGHGGQTTGSTTSAPGDCGGGALSLAGDPCVDHQASVCGVALAMCAGDTDCGDPGTVCHKCDAAFSYCQAKCTKDADCPGQTCDTGGHCAPKACTMATDCPANLTCSTADGFCVRKTCSADADCSGSCVSGICADHPAYCSDCT